MMDVDEVIGMLSKLSYEETLAYWISGEKEEAELYKELAERTKALGLEESIVKVFEKLSKDSQRHADELGRVFRESFLIEPKTNIPPVEVLSVLNKFERADQIKEVLEAAMESELTAHKVYKLLTEKAEDERLKELYLKLAEVEKTHYEALKTEYEKLGG
ncbi:ferritin family protein [Thermococcus sp. Bubb.Bath]|uniref:ferritin-like domain-containing protein n=1 Tax=Thermococcus sp. Bubb.Bath TaxID=1638242 RepID=UPI00143C8C0E|nr:ferritin family protein [Thermococcus sp. Bubb.Bath]NJF25124.1 rubrerythrin [Thermococcus sp. Bubb.Bath]